MMAFEKAAALEEVIRVLRSEWMSEAKMAMLREEQLD